MLGTDRRDDTILLRFAEHVIAKIADRFLASGVDENSGAVAVAGSPFPAVLGPIGKRFGPLSMLRVYIRDIVPVETRVGVVMWTL